MNALALNTLARLAVFQIVAALLLFLPAWTLHFWQAWLFWTIEERFLLANLPGYSEYCRKVRFHLLPGLW